MANLSEGYVVGLGGEWGAGKSSVVNMTLHHLLHLDLSHSSRDPAFHGDKGGREIAADLDDLAVHYEAIRELHEQFADVPYLHPDHYHRAIVTRAENDEVMRKRIYRYFRLRMNAHFRPRNLVVHFRPWLVPDTAALSSVFLDELTKSIGPLLGSDVEDAMKNYTAVVKRLAPIAGVAAHAVVPGSGNAIRDFVASLGNTAEATLESRKLKLEASLRKLRGQKIIVVIDDLDRLSPKEATEMVGLVKSLGNLPNIVYLMSYDPKVLCRHLRGVLRLNAEEYLEKIVQYRRNLPLLPADRLLALLDDCRTELFDSASPELLDRARDANFYVLRQFIRTPRDAVRCGDWAVRAHRILKDQTDPVDLLILEVLNAKDTVLYQWIRHHLSELCSGEMPNRNSLEQALEADGIEVTEERKYALSQLFPAASQEFHRPGNNSSNDRLSKRLRVREYAETYFELSEPATGSGKAELNRLFAGEDPKIVMTPILERSKVSDYGSSIRAELLDTIWEHFSRNPITRAWVGALTDLGPELIVFRDRDTGDIFAPDNLRRLTGAIVSGLSQLNIEEKVNLMKFMLARSEDLSLVASVLRRIGSTREGNQDGEYMDLESVREELVNKLEVAIANDRVLSSAYPAHVVFLASEILGPHIIREHLNRALRLNRYFPAIAETLLNEGNSSDRGQFYSLMSNMSDFADSDLFIQVARDLLDDTGDEGIWAKRAINALLRNRNGED